jgi:hypothetical protein
MVAKLLVAVQETWRSEQACGKDDATLSALAKAYHQIRDGLGFRKTPAEYGAFPTDPYSHTPRHRGAQQPGMTGQVKEEILTRWGELGVEVKGGSLHFDPRLIGRTEFNAKPSSFAWVDVTGREQTWELPAGSLAFTYCQVAVCYTLSDAAGLTLWRTGGASEQAEGTALTPEQSKSVLERSGEIGRVLVSCLAAEVSAA